MSQTHRAAVRQWMGIRSAAPSKSGEVSRTFIPNPSYLHSCVTTEPAAHPQRQAETAGSVFESDSSCRDVPEEHMRPCQRDDDAKTEGPRLPARDVRGAMRNAYPIQIQGTHTTMWGTRSRTRLGGEYSDTHRAFAVPPTTCARTGINVKYTASTPRMH